MGYSVIFLCQRDRQWVRLNEFPQGLKPISIFDLFMYGLKPVPFTEARTLH